MNLWKKFFFILWNKDTVANHRFLAKNIFAMLGKDDQQKGTVLPEKHKTVTFFSSHNTQSPRSGSFIFKMATMLQIPWGLSPVSCLGSANVIQCPRPGPKFGNKSQQIPHYPPVCPRGQPPRMAADKCIIFEMLFIKELKPRLKTHKDSVRAKLFRWHCAQIYIQVTFSYPFWLENDVEQTSKRCCFLKFWKSFKQLFRVFNCDGFNFCPVAMFSH